MTEATLADLRSVFPDLEVDILSEVLAFHNGNLELAVGALLDDSGPVAVAAPDLAAEDAADEVARQIQLELDEEVAREAQADEEASAAAREARQNESRGGSAPTAQAVASAAGKMGAAAKTALARALSKRSMKAGSTRLLDDQAGSSEYSPADSLAPLTINATLSPVVPSYSPPPVPQGQLHTPPLVPAADTPTDAISPLEGLAPTYSANYPASTPAPNPASNPAAYSARMSRARSANTASGRSMARSPTGGSVSPPPPSASPPAVDLLGGLEAPESPPARAPPNIMDAPPARAPPTQDLLG